jgi:calcium-dependent protein kinase
MWSFGVVMFVMLFGFPPFHGDSDPIIFSRIRAGFDPTVKKGWGPWFPAQAPCSAAARDLISKLLTKDASARLSAKETLDHPWMQGKDVPLHPLPATVVSNLGNLVKKTRFSNEILCYLTQSSMQTDEYVALAKTFRYIDKNNDGTLSVEEFRQALMETENRVLDDAQLRQAIALADMDGDGTISWKELLLATTARRLAAKEERLWTSFKKMDLNNDGKLSVQELELALGKDTEEVRSLIAEVDKDNNGMVDYDEFLSIFSEQAETENTSLLDHVK